MRSFEVHGIVGYELSTDTNRFDFDAIHAYLSRSYWAARIPRATVELAALYSRFGFRAVPADSRLMQIVRPDIYGGDPG